MIGWLYIDPHNTLGAMPFSHATPYSKLTDEQHMLIGMFVSEWATAEFYLGLILGRLLLAPEYLSRTYTDSLGAAQLQDAIRQAVGIQKERYSGKLVAADLLDEILALNRKIEKLRSLRNKFAHFCWMRTSDQEMFGTNFSGAPPNDKRHKGSMASLKVSEIRQQHQELFQAVERLQAIVGELPEVSEEAAIAAFKASKEGPHNSFKPKSLRG